MKKIFLLFPILSIVSCGKKNASILENLSTKEIQSLAEKDPKYYQFVDYVEKMKGNFSKADSSKYATITYDQLFNFYSIIYGEEADIAHKDLFDVKYYKEYRAKYYPRLDSLIKTDWRPAGDRSWYQELKEGRLEKDNIIVDGIIREALDPDFVDVFNFPDYYTENWLKSIDPICAELVLRYGNYKYFDVDEAIERTNNEYR